MEVIRAIKYEVLCSQANNEIQEVIDTTLQPELPEYKT